MKILLDECVTKHLKPHLTDHEVLTVREMQWGGIKNGMLLALCAEQRFDMLLTIDKNLKYEQNLDKYPLRIVVLNSFTSKIEELVIFYRLLILNFQTLRNTKYISKINEVTYSWQ